MTYAAAVEQPAIPDTSDDLTPEELEQARTEAVRHYEEQKAERAALPADRLATPFLVTQVVKFALRHSGILQPFVPEVLVLTGVKPERLRLGERAFALWHADMQLKYVEKGEAQERVLDAEGRPLRDRILGEWGQPMVSWKVLTKAELAELKVGRDRDDLASDLVFIGRRVVSKWDDLKTRVTFPLSDATRAIAVGEALLRARSQGASHPGFEAVVDDHRRAFTLVVESIDEFRSGLGWTRRDERGFKVDEVCPSPYSVRYPIKPKSKAKAAKAAKPTEPTEPTESTEPTEA